MNFIIHHKGLNSKKVASKLHDMINEGYRDRFKKKLEDEIEVDSDKKMFVDAMKEKEIEFLIKGFKTA